MAADQVQQVLNDFIALAKQEFNEDPTSQALREYIATHYQNAKSIAKSIQNYVTGETGITLDAIEKCKQDIVRLGQIAHVIKTMPAGDTPYRLHIVNDIRNLLEAAIQDYHTILNWTRFGGERRL